MKMLPSEYGRIFSCYLQKRKDIDMTAQEISDKFGVPKKTMYRYANISKLTEELQNYADSKVINVDSVDYICNFSEENQNVLCEFIEKTDKKHKITVSLAKKMAKIVENYDNDTVPVHEFTALVVKPEKKSKSYKNAVYNTVAEKYKIEYSEKELDDIVTKLLEKYFSDKK
jgi:protein-tyrosine-phosphatase